MKCGLFATWPGELLASTPLQSGGDAARARSPDATEQRPPRLGDLGISTSQSSRWQALASVPGPVFDDYIADAREKGRRDGSAELTIAGALTVARQYRPPYRPCIVSLHCVPVVGSDRFDLADAAALPWPDNSVDVVVTSPPDALDIDYAGGDVGTYVHWLQALADWLKEMSRIAKSDSGRLCLNVPLDRDRGGWESVSADALQVARESGWRFRTWLLWDKGQAGAGTDRGSLDSAAAPNATAAAESVLVLYRGEWRRPGPAAMPHEDWLELCGPRGVWRISRDN
jgi:hypothetical protein